MAFPKIGYRSIIETASVLSASSEASGFPVTNIKDRKVYTIWKAANLSAQDIDIDMGSAATADSICLAGGNLAAENVTLTVKSDTTPAPAVVRATVAPADWPASGVYMKEFSSQNHRYWRLSLTAASANAAYLGDVRLGVILTLTEYLAAAVDAQVEMVEASIERAEGGHALGAAMRRVVRKFNIDIGPAGAEWSTAFTPANLINDFWTNHARKYRTFFFHGNIADATVFAPMYLTIQQDATIDRPVIGGRYLRRGFILPVESAIAETP